MPPRLTDADIRAAAAKARVDVKALRAVIAVESGGSGFLSDGRLKILFEAHWMWRRLSARGINPRPLNRSYPGLCHPNWSRAYYVGGAGEYDRIERVLQWAQANAPERFESYKKAAYEACSWGLFQIMGLHYERLGFPNVYAYKHYCEDGEPQQLECFLRFVETGGILDELRRRDWIGFTRHYNGLGQVPVYSARLALAFRKARP